MDAAASTHLRMLAEGHRQQQKKQQQPTSG
jgi:hypothetical protein